jgi:hypothetical protein
MPLANETVMVLWWVAGAVVLWRVLPAVLNAQGLTLRRGVIDHDVEALEPTGDDAEYQELFGQLCTNSLEPVGLRRTTCWFFLHHWRKVFRSRVFTARPGDCIALVYRLRDWDRWRLCFVTAFNDGSIVETANQMESFRIEEPDHLRWGLATPDRTLLLARHREACRDFAAKASRQVALLPADDVNRLIRDHEMRHHRRRHRWTGLKAVANSCWALCVLLLLARRFATTAPYLMPVSVIAWGFLWPVIHASLFRAGVRSFQADDARRQRSLPSTGTVGR